MYGVCRWGEILRVVVLQGTGVHRHHSLVSSHAPTSTPKQHALTRLQADAEAIAHSEYVFWSDNGSERSLTRNTTKVRAGFKSTCPKGEDRTRRLQTAPNMRSKQSVESEPSTPARSSQYSRLTDPIRSKRPSSNTATILSRPEALTSAIQIHAGNMQRKVRRDRREFPHPDGPTSFPPRLDEHPLWYASAGLGDSRRISIATEGEALTNFVRCRSLQGGSWPGFDGEAPDRDDFPGLCPPPEGTPMSPRAPASRSMALTLDLVLAKFVPVQAAQEGRSGSHGDAHQAVKRASWVPRPGSPALGQVARYQPYHAHSTRLWLPERRQELLRPLGDSG